MEYFYFKIDIIITETCMVVQHFIPLLEELQVQKGRNRKPTCYQFAWRTNTRIHVTFVNSQRICLGNTKPKIHIFQPDKRDPHDHENSKEPPNRWSTFYWAIKNNVVLNCQTLIKKVRVHLIFFYFPFGTFFCLMRGG